MSRASLETVLLVLLLVLPGCLHQELEDAGLLIATTTSMRDSGLMDALIEAFESSAGIEVEYVAVGTGAALELGREGDVDMVIVHAPDREQVFLDSGSGSNRTTFAWNRFVLLSPTPPPLDANLTETMRSIVEEDACFISRGDDSGTHTKEQAIWTAVGENHGMSMVEDDLGLHPSWPGYLSSGQGMAASLTMADELDCWCLSDRGTYLNLRGGLDLHPIEFQESMLVNPYSALLLPGPQERQMDAVRFTNWLVSPEAVQVIESHEVDGEMLFVPGSPDQVV